MIPVLIVEGVAHKVEGIDYLDGKPKTVIVEQNGRKMFYWDKSASKNPNALDLEYAIIWQGRYDPIYEAIEKVIDDKCLNLIELAICHIENDKPFTPSQHKEQYKLLQREVFGLMDAQDVVSEFMQEDVDLSGGEEIEG